MTMMRPPSGRCARAALVPTKAARRSSATISSKSRSVIRLVGEADVGTRHCQRLDDAGADAAAAAGDQRHLADEGRHDGAPVSLTMPRTWVASAAIAWEETNNGLGPSEHRRQQSDLSGVAS